MPKFRKRPVIIEAIKWNGFSTNLGLTNGDPMLDGAKYEMPSWMPPVTLVVSDLKYPAYPAPGQIWRDGEDLWIGTLEGNMVASPGDWIICGIKGELYPCKPDIFEASYEKVLTLRDRCREIYQRMGRDAMLRQGSPVDDLTAFVVSEIGRAADEALEPSLPLCLYFVSEKDREEFVALVHEAKPHMIAKRWPR